MNETLRLKSFVVVIGLLLGFGILYYMLGSDYHDAGERLERTQNGVQHARRSNERARTAHQQIETEVSDLGNHIQRAEKRAASIERESAGAKSDIGELSRILERDRASLAHIRTIIERTEEASREGTEKDKS